MNRNLRNKKELHLLHLYYTSMYSLNIVSLYKKNLIPRKDILFGLKCGKNLVIFFPTCFCLSLNICLPIIALTTLYQFQYPILQVQH